MNIETNKILAAILVAGIVASFSGFIAERAMSPEHIEAPVTEVVASHEAVAGTAAEAKPEGAEPVMALIAGADLERGQKVFKACSACHTPGKDGGHRVGPNLWNMMIAPKASAEGYSYSDALKNLGGTWDYDSLNKFLWKPKEYAPRTRMGYAGMKKVADRAALIAYLRTLADSPIDLPSEDQIAAE